MERRKPGEGGGSGNSKTIKPACFITLYHARGTFILSVIIIPSGERAGEIMRLRKTAYMHYGGNNSHGAQEGVASASGGSIFGGILSGAEVDTRDSHCLFLSSEVL